LLLTTVKFFFPVSRNATSRFSGMPHHLNPPMARVIPSSINLSRAAIGLGHALLIDSALSPGYLGCAHTISIANRFYDDSDAQEITRLRVGNRRSRDFLEISFHLFESLGNLRLL
jgi:hypothetical protein